MEAATKDWLIGLFRAFEAARTASARKRAQIYGYPGPRRRAAAAAPANDPVANDTAASRQRAAA